MSAQRASFNKKGGRGPERTTGGPPDAVPGSAGEAVVNALPETEQEWRIAFDSIRDLVMTLDCEFRIVRANAAVASFFDLPLERILGRPCYSLMHGTSEPMAGCPLGNAIRAHKHEEAEVFDEKRNRWLLVSVDPIFDGNGNVKSLVHTVRDVTESKRAERALTESEERFRLATEAVNGSVYDCDWPGRTFIWSEGLATILGYRPAEERLSVAWWLAQMHPEDRSRFSQELDEAFAQGLSARSYEYRVRHMDGCYVWVEDKHRILYTEDGRPARLIGCTVSIDARKKAEEEARQLREDLARRSRISAMGELTATIAHELNQPVSAIITNAQACRRLLSRPDPDLDEIRTALGELISDGVRVNEVVGRVREFLRRGEAEKARIDVNAIVRTVVPIVKTRLLKDQIVLELDLGRDIPPVTGVSGQLQQVVFNLIINAIDAVARVEVSSRKVKVVTRLLPTGMVSVAVEDSGIGVPAEDLGRIFDAFFTTKDDGTGMGLPICRSIVEAHGGRLWAESDGRTGSVFQFTVPVVEDLPT